MNPARARRGDRGAATHARTRGHWSETTGKAGGQASIRKSEDRPRAHGPARGHARSGSLPMDSRLYDVIHRRRDVRGAVHRRARSRPRSSTASWPPPTPRPASACPSRGTSSWSATRPSGPPSTNTSRTSGTVFAATLDGVRGAAVRPDQDRRRTGVDACRSWSPTTPTGAAPPCSAATPSPTPACTRCAWPSRTSGWPPPPRPRRRLGVVLPRTVPRRPSARHPRRDPPGRVAVPRAGDPPGNRPRPRTARLAPPAPPCETSSTTTAGDLTPARPGAPCHRRLRGRWRTPGSDTPRSAS